ncbi:uncharacterized protein LOC132064126 [Lycium ferocissimum]|uniref:uncharacterized protein LOC132064126 n=1 Tax=Lycium ferocissimum TaxID=112874 RepID=UPI00281654EA|nr:uncharacterized protein LOC132064126 [Lycium ferocissimum]
MEHLSRTGSDHAPLLLSAGEQVQQFQKHFRFLKFWLDHESFMDAVDQHWRTEFIGDPFIIFKLKMKSLKAALSRWSKETFGDLFKQLIIREDIVKIKEQLFEEEPSEENRIVLREGIQWHLDGDRNTRYFHSIVKGIRKRLLLTRIQNADGEWVDNLDDIATEAISFYQNQFSQESGRVDSNLLDHIPERISEDQNNFLCWNIVGADVYNVISSFYERQTLPKSVTQTNLVLLPKKEIINTFSYTRGQSPQQFHKQDYFVLLHDKLEVILPSLISPNQSGFVKGRNIIENVLLTQELVAAIRKRGKPTNVIIKLDMENDYDRLSWRFLVQILVKDGICRRRGQTGDPLSPRFFILAVEVANELNQEVQQITSFNKGDFPFTYLGCPIFHARRQKLFYKDMMKKVKDVVVCLERFFWQTKEEGRSKHWLAWENVCYPKNKGGLGFRSLHDISKALFAKLWWRFRQANINRGPISCGTNIVKGLGQPWFK